MARSEGLLILTFASALGSGLIAGVFFAFSTFVMRALSRLPPAQGIAAMQAINVAAINVAFMAALFGTAVGCVLLLAGSLAPLDRPQSSLVVTAALLYLIGVVGVTIAANVPRNNRLAAVDPEAAASAAVWADYLAQWTAWNHVRTAAALAASALLMKAALP